MKEISETKLVKERKNSDGSITKLPGITCDGCGKEVWHYKTYEDDNGKLMNLGVVC